MPSLRPLLLKLLCIVGLLVVIVQIGLAQAPPSDPTAEFGTLPYKSYDGGNIDSINLLNLSLNLHIPLASYPQRGGKLPLSFSIDYIAPTLSWVWNYSSPDCDPDRPNLCNEEWSLTPEGVTPAFPFDAGIEIVPDNMPANAQFNSGQNYWYLQLSDGSSHVLAYNTSSTQLTTDPSGWLVSVATDSSCTDGVLNRETIIDRNGNRYIFACDFLTSMQDANGNQITESSPYAPFIDTLGRSIPYPEIGAGFVNTSDLSGCTGTLPIENAELWTIPGPNGTPITYKICYGTVTINLPNCSNINGDWTTRCIFDPTGTSIQSIVLPDGKAWTFTYDSSTSPNQYAYGDLTSITFPTGGTISYVWSNLPELVACENSGLQFGRRGVQSRTVNANDGQGPHQWTYSMANVGSGEFPPIQTTVIDAAANQTLHTFSALNGSTCAYFETETQNYQGSGPSATPLEP